MAVLRRTPHLALHRFRQFPPGRRRALHHGRQRLSLGPGPTHFQRSARELPSPASHRQTVRAWMPRWLSPRSGSSLRPCLGGLSLEHVLCTNTAFVVRLRKKRRKKKSTKASFLVMGPAAELEKLGLLSWPGRTHQDRSVAASTGASPPTMPVGVFRIVIVAYTWPPRTSGLVCVVGAVLRVDGPSCCSS